LSKNLRAANCSGINYLSHGISILARDDSVSVKFGLKGTHPQYEGRAFLKLND